MTHADPKSKFVDLAKPARSRLDEFLQLEELRKEQWLMRLSVNGRAHGWEPLSGDTAQNDALIKERIAAREKPVTELLLGFAGMVQWRGRRQFMAYLQYFESGCEQGLLCFRCLKDLPHPGKFEGFGEITFIGCKNTWI